MCTPDNDGGSRESGGNAYRMLYKVRHTDNITMK
jgi:hypothetical protein